MKLFGFGTTRIDLFIYTPHEPKCGGEVKLEGIRFNIGGSVLNTATILHYLGCDITFYTHVGNDEFGEIAKRHLDDINLKFINTCKSKEEKTATSFIVVDKTGERTMYSYDNVYGIDFKLDKHIINEASFCDGFFTSCYEIFDKNAASLMELLKRFRSENKPTFLDLSPLVYLVSYEVWESLLPYFSILIGTEYEFDQLADILKLDSIYDIKNKYNIDKLYIKMGPKGSRVVGSQELYDKVIPIESKNLTCCGDTYNAGAILGELNNDNEENILKISNFLAGQVAKNGFTPKKIVKKLFQKELNKPKSSKTTDYIRAGAAMFEEHLKS